MDSASPASLPRCGAVLCIDFACGRTHRAHLTSRFTGRSLSMYATFHFYTTYLSIVAIPLAPHHPLGPAKRGSIPLVLVLSREAIQVVLCYVSVRLCPLAIQPSPRFSSRILIEGRGAVVCVECRCARQARLTTCFAGQSMSMYLVPQLWLFCSRLTILSDRQSGVYHLGFACRHHTLSRLLLDFS
ncbi:hypothetical protein ACLOJK_028409 [Asimina triloba]